MEIILFILSWPVAGFVGMVLQWLANQIVKRATNGARSRYNIFPQSMIMGGYFTLVFGVQRVIVARSNPYDLVSADYINQDIFQEAAQQKAQFIEKGIRSGKVILKMVTDMGKYTDANPNLIPEEMTLSGMWVFTDKYNIPTPGSLVSVVMKVTSNSAHQCTFVPKPQLGEIKFWGPRDNQLPTNQSITMSVEHGNVRIGGEYLFQFYITPSHEMPSLQRNSLDGVWISLTDNTPYGQTFLVAQSPSDPDSYIHEFLCHIEPL
jgi:hypothetical protein